MHGGSDRQPIVYEDYYSTANVWRWTIVPVEPLAPRQFLLFLFGNLCPR
jgi:hypothetical protein